MAIHHQLSGVTNSKVSEMVSDTVKSVRQKANTGRSKKKGLINQQNRYVLYFILL